MNVKASAIKLAIELDKYKYGNKIFEKLLDDLNEKDRKIVSSSLLDTSWVPLEVFAYYLESAVKIIYNGDESKLVKDVEEASEKHLRGIYHVFVKLGSPEFIVKRTVAAAKTYYQGIEATAKITGPKQALLTFTGYKKEHRIIELSILGWIKCALRLSGAKNIKCDVVRSLANDKGYFELTTTWT